MSKWQYKKISELGDVVSGGTPSREISEYWGDGYSWVTPTDITGTKGVFLESSKESITELGLKNSSAKMLPVGTILMTSRATLGESKISKVPVCTNQGFKSIVVNRNVSNHFLRYSLIFNKNKYANLGIGTTFLEVNKSDTDRFEVFVPDDIKEQQKIAQILYSIDEQIELTEKLIEKKRLIKKGLLSELLSKHSKGNENTIILNELLYGVRGVSYTPSQLLSEQSSHSFTLLRSNNIKDNRINFDSIQLVPKDLVSDDQKAAPGDIAVCMSNGSRSLVGKSASFSDGIKGLNVTVGAFCSIFKPKDIADASFLSHLFQSSLYQKHIDIVLAGSAINNLQNKVIESLKIPHINKNARLQIGEILNSADIELDSLINGLEKLKLQKQGLMQDLLTGQVRVS